MSSTKPPAKEWEAMVPGQRLQVCLIQIEVSYHRELRSGYSAQDMESVRTVVANALLAIAELRGGRLHTWDDEGGVFLFLADRYDGFDNCCLTAIQMLEMMPSINEDVRLSTDIAQPVEVCITCDTGLVAHAPDPAAVAGGFVDALIEHRRRLGAKNCVTITERVYRQLSRPFKSRFTTLKYSKELEVDLHRTSAIEDDPALDEPDGPPARRPDAERDTARPSPGHQKPREDRREPARPSLGGRIDRLGPWPKAAALAGVFLAGLVLGRALLPTARPAAPIAAAAPAAAAVPDGRPDPAWGEPFSSPGWIAWRKHVHETLSGAKVTEKTLIEALRGIPSSQLTSPAALLRRDQEIGDVLLKHVGVQNLLYDRFGIGEHFLGTGLSNPVNVTSYWSASVHEYLVPNVPDNSSQVLMRKSRDFPVVMEKTVAQVIEEAEEHDAEKQALKKTIVALAGAKERVRDLPPVIRFARLNDNETEYSRRLGRSQRARVFASDLAEIWDLKVKDAAARSGYTFEKPGDTFFIWVFVPSHGDEVIPASWTEVLQRLPKWLEPYVDKVP